MCRRVAHYDNYCNNYKLLTGECHCVNVNDVDKSSGYA